MYPATCWVREVHMPGSKCCFQRSKGPAKSPRWHLTQPTTVRATCTTSPSLWDEITTMLPRHREHIKPPTGANSQRTNGSGRFHWSTTIPTLAVAQKMSEAVVAGHICLDVFPTLAGGNILFRPGQTIEAGPVIFSTGGPVSNTGLALHKLGVATRLMAKIGTDLFGQAIRQILESHGPGLSQEMILARGEASSYSIILSPPGADRMFIHAPGCNATFGADDVRSEALDTARLFHFGYPPLMQRMYANDGVELAAIFSRVKALGLTTSLDLSMPDPNSAAGRANWHAILRATLPHVDVFLPSAEEILFMLRRQAFDRFAAMSEHSRPLDHIEPAMIEELGQELLDMGAKIVALKIGERGLYLRTASATALTQMGRCLVADVAAWSDRELWAPCFAVHVAGTTGSV